MNKEWRPVVGYEGLYEVSNAGQIKRVAGGSGSKPGRILKNQLKRGYHQIGLYLDGALKWHAVHKLVAEAFIELKKPGLQINHKDGNKLNNSPENLEWVTSAENHAHRRQYLGMSNKGKRNGRTILTASQVLEIRDIYDSGNHSWAKIAEPYGVHPTTIGAIVKRRNWKHI